MPSIGVPELIIFIVLALIVFGIWQFLQLTRKTSSRSFTQTKMSAQTQRNVQNLTITQTANATIPAQPATHNNSIFQNRYQIIRPLGSGGQASVYLTQHLGLGGKYVALKQNVGGNPQQFQNEAILLANLTHPNLLRVLDHFVEPNGTAYLVMDFVDGQSLDALVAQHGVLNEGNVLQWLRPVFGAVKYLHANGIIHRDIKPANIIITPQGRAILVDFGIAKTLASGSVTSTSVRGMGTPGYAPPEQYVGGTTERSDIYALGATLYYVLTARVLVESPYRAAGSVLTPLHQINGAVSARTEDAISIAMNLDAQQRFATIALMEKALY